MTIKVFHSKNCPHCREALKEIKKSCCDYELIDVDKHPDIADRYEIWSIPTSVLENGKKVHTLTAFENCKCKINRRK